MGIVTEGVRDVDGDILDASDGSVDFEGVRLGCDDGTPLDFNEGSPLQLGFKDGANDGLAVLDGEMLGSNDGSDILGSDDGMRLGSCEG